MGTYVITAPNGPKFKVTAPDQQTALDAFAAEAGLAGETTPEEVGGNLPSMAIPGVEQAQDFSRSFQSGATQGMTLGFGDEMYAGVTAPFRAGYNMLTGQAKDFDLGRGWEEGLASARGGLEADAARNPAASVAGDVAGSVLLGGTAAKGGLTLLNGVKPTVAAIAPRAAIEGALYGGASGFGRADGTMDDRLKGAQDGALWGAGAGAVLGGGVGALAGRGAKAAVPTVEQLENAAGVKYDAARASGVVAPQGSTQGISSTIRKIAVDEGLISPTGRLDTTRPYIAEAIRTFEDYSQGTMTVPQMQAVRRKLTDAAKSTEPGERRIAMKMLDEFDTFTDNLAPQLAEGNALYHQAKNGELIERTVELAGSRAGQFSGSGFENALRTEFRALERAIIKGELKGLSQAEIDAITKVARGGAIENLARYVGKLAPTGAVSFGASAGVPFMIGNAVGGPAMGAAAAGATMGAGFFGRSAATAMTNANAVKAALIARNGGIKPSVSPLGVGQEQVARALISSGGNEAARIPKVPIEILVTGGAR